jgi:hypothetical protein
VDEWFADFINSQVGPEKPKSTADALGVGSDYRPLRALRRAAGGAVEGLLNIPIDSAELGSKLPAVGPLAPIVNALQALANEAPEYREATGRVREAVGGAWTGEAEADPAEAGRFAAGFAPLPFAMEGRAVGAVDDLLRVARNERGALMGNTVAGLTGKDANEEVLRAARSMIRQQPMPRVAQIDKPRARQMAKAYERLPANDPNAKSAYDALNREVEAQFKAAEDAGFRFEFVKEDPYKNSAEMMKDVRENKRLRVFATPEDSFHPYLTPEQNNKFRAVHDWIAHAGPGNQFGPIGEENAYRLHAATLSPQAQRALASETRGQNSWVNFGPNENLPAAQRPFAEQKAALWPEELLGDYSSMPDHVPSPEPAGRPAAVSRGAAQQPITARAHDLKTPPAAQSFRERNLIKALSGEGGATLTAEGAPFAGSGYAVARPELTAFAKSPEEMRAFLQRPEVQKALREGAYIGKWTDPSNGVTEINITDILPDEAAARQLGVQREQKALGHLKDGVYQGDISLQSVAAGPARSAVNQFGELDDVLLGLGGHREARPGALPTPGPLKFTGEKPGSMSNLRSYTGDAGEQVSLYYNRPSPDELNIDFIGSHGENARGDTGANTIGPAGLRSILADLRTAFPEVRKVTGSRVTGVRADRPGRVEVPLPGPGGFGLGGYIPEQKPLTHYRGPKIKESDLAEAYERSRKAFDARGPFAAFLDRGRKFPGAPAWYDTRPIYRDAADVIGDEAAAERVNRLLGKIMPSVTARSSPPGNLKRAFLWEHLLDNGLLAPEQLRTHKVIMPPGFGHFAQGAHQSALANTLERGLVDPITNPKPAGFGANLTGNQEAITFDTVMGDELRQLDPDALRFFEVKKDGVTPRKWAYQPLERGLADAAHDAAARGLIDVEPGLSPGASYQSIGWHGGTKSSGFGGAINSADYGSMTDIWRALRSRSAELWGVSPARANELIWGERKVPLIALGKDIRIKTRKR